MVKTRRRNTTACKFLIALEMFESSKSMIPVAQ